MQQIGWLAIPPAQYAMITSNIRYERDTPVLFSVPDVSSRPFKVAYYKHSNDKDPYKIRSIWTTLKNFQNLFISNLNKYAANKSIDITAWHMIVEVFLSKYVKIIKV